MEHFPEIKKTIHVPVEIPALPYLQDHMFEKLPVLPAVEACEYIAHALLNHYPQMDIHAISSGRFERFLPLPVPIGPTACLCKLSPLRKGLIEGTLLTKKTGKKSQISRSLEHASMVFGEKKPPCLAPKSQDEDHKQKFEISPRKIYDELVLFGPSYQTITHLTLSEKIADGIIMAPETGNSKNSALGSPFILDGAFHAACVWAQRFCSCVPFPVGFGHRAIYRKTEPHTSYRVRVIPMEKEGDCLNFNIWIIDERGTPFEYIEGVRMRDLSRGRLKPPAWISRDLSS